MVCDKDNPGILDFQDAVEGPFTYDLVSLLKDCYIRCPAKDVHEYAVGFFNSCGARLQSGMNATRFGRYFELMGVQRHLKAAGIFARLKHRDGKSAYLGDVPRTLRYISEIAPRYPELTHLSQLISTRCLPLLEAQA
jgi:aminoglycoside/choline kinase family phosphotransferase